MKLFKLKKQVISVLCGLSLLFGAGGIATLQKSNNTPMITVDAAADTVIGLDAGCYITNEGSASRFRLPLNSPICDKNAGTSTAFQAGTLADLNGLEDKLLIAGKTPTEWSKLDVGFSISFRSSQCPVFHFDKTKLGNLKQNFFNGPFVVELKEDCVLNNNYGTVKAFAVYSTGQGNSTNTCGASDLTLKQDRAEGPFYYEGVNSGMLQVKMWFAESVMIANDVTGDTNIDIDKMEGLQHALYFNGKSIAEWALEGALGTVTARASGGFVFRFNTTKFDTSKEYLIQIKNEVQTTKGVVQPFTYKVKAGFTFGNFNNSDGTPNGNGTLIVTKKLVIKQDRAEGPFLYEGVTNGMLRVKMWFAESVIAKNDGSDVNISVSDLEGLQNALYFNGKSLAEWGAEGALTVTARTNGGFIFYFNTAKFDYSKAYLIEIREEVQTTKGLVQPFAYWVKAGFNFGNFFNSDGSATGNGYVYQGKTLEFLNSAFELKMNNVNTLKMWFTEDGENGSPIVTTDTGENLASGVDYLEGLQNALKIDGKTIAEWETLLGNGFFVGSRARDGRFTPQFNLASLGENNFIGKNFVVELANDCMTSQGVVKAFKYVYNWALGQGALNPTEEVRYSSADSFHNMDEFFYFDVTFDKDILVSAPTVDTPLSNDALQKADLSNLVKVNGKDVPTAMYSVQALKDTTNVLRFSVNNAEKSHNFYFELLAGYVFPNGNVLAEDITLYYNEQNGTWRTTAMPDITVAYNANGGVGEMVGSTVAYASDYELQENAFTRQNYAFLGWARTADGEVVFQNGETLHLYVGGALENVNSTTLELFAVWKKTRGVQYVSVSTAGDIGLNFYVDLDDATEATATVTMKGETATVVGVQAQDGLWKFTYGVAPKDYQETVTLTVEDITASYSVEKYAQALPTTNKAYPLVSALIEYCEAARMYFAKETATATEALTADLTNFAGSVVGTQAGVSDVGATLTLEAKTTISVYFTAESLTGIVCKVDGKVVTPKAVAGANGRYVITIEDVVAKDLDVLYTISIGDCTVTYGALSYVVSMHNSEDVALANVVKALYKFNVQANEYFAGV